MSFIGFALCAVLFINNANAIGLDDLTNKETSGALKEALIQAAGKAVGNLGANDAQMTLQRVKQLAGSMELYVKNNGAAALNGNVVISFWIYNQ